MNTDAAQLYQTCLQLFNEASQLRNHLQRHLDFEPEVAAIADIGFAMRQCENLIDRLRKDLKATGYKAQMLVCKKWMLLGAEAPAIIRTEHMSATPDITSKVSVPSLKSDPDAYEALMVGYLSIPEHYCLKYEAVRPHYHGMNDLVTDLEGEGKPLPPGITPQRVHNDFKVSFRKKKEPNE